MAVSQTLRLLFLDVGDRRMPQISLSKESFENVETHFHLHPATIPCVFRKGGLSFALKDVDPLSGALNRVFIIIRSPHSGKAGIRFLSMTHDFKAQLTTGVMLGDATVETASLNSGYRLNLEQVLLLIKSNPDVWTHPTFLATVMLYMRIDYFSEHSQTIMRSFSNLENAVGISDRGHIGVTSNPQALEEWPDSVSDKKLTVQIHTVANRIVLMEDVTKWQRRCTDCLIDTERMIENSPLQDSEFRSRSQKLQDVLNYLSSTSDGIEAVVRSMQQRVQMQINVVSSLSYRTVSSILPSQDKTQLTNLHQLASAASQKDNQIGRKQNAIAEENNKLNIRIATSTKKDSVAMMAFTFITAFFLPGTYVASLFSTGMFDWQVGSTSTNQETSTTTVSEKFWIYWVVTTPLTAVVMLGWFVWYRVADVAWQKTTGLLPGLKEN